MVSRDRAPDQGRSQDFFLPRDAMRKRGLCGPPVSVCLSVRPSVCHGGGLYPDCWRYRQTSFWTLYHHRSSFFVPPAPIPNFNWKPFSGGIKYMGWEKFAIFDWIRRLSRKRYEIGSCMVAMGTLIGSGRRRIDPCRFRWPWVTLNPGFPSHCIHSLQVE